MGNQSRQSQADNDQQARGGEQPAPLSEKKAKKSPNPSHGTGGRNSDRLPQQDSRDRHR